MAENTHFPDNSPSPFRRYVPASSHNHRADSRDNPQGAGQVMPFPSSAQGAAKATTTTPASAPHQRRNRRSRWRQLAVSHTTPQAGQRNTAQPPQVEQAPPSIQTSQPMKGQSRSNPKGAQATPSRPRGRQSAVADKTVQGHPFQRSSATPGSIAPHPSDYPASQASFDRGRTSQMSPEPSPRSAFPSKVTPLHRRKSRRSPQAVSPEKRSVAPMPRRGRKVARSQGRPAPRPVLYGLRLLIVGTGIAALVGTLLSTLKPEGQGTPSAPPSVGLTQNTGALPRQHRNQNSLADGTLPLTEEIVHLETDLLALEAMTPGLSQSVFFYDLDTGEYLDLNGTEAVAAASTIKVPILVAFLEAIDNKTITLNQALTLREDLVVGGSGEMQTHAIGSQYTAWEVATEMIVSSDNSATNMLIELLGGKAVLNQQFQQWGLSSTVIRNALPDLDGTNTTSPADLVRLLALVDRGALLSGRSRDRLFSIMRRTRNRTLIPDGVRDEAALAFNKTGDIGRALADVALIDVANGKRYIVSISVARPDNDGRASELIRRVAGRIHEEVSHPITPVGQRAVPNPSSVPVQAPETYPGNSWEETSPASTNRESSIKGLGEQSNSSIPRG